MGESAWSSTASMTCITPLEQSTSLIVTVAGLIPKRFRTSSLAATSITMLPPLSIITLWPSHAIVAGESTEPSNTWYVRISIRVALFAGSKREATNPGDNASNASTV